MQTYWSEERYQHSNTSVLEFDRNKMTKFLKKKYYLKICSWIDDLTLYSGQWTLTVKVHWPLYRVKLTYTNIQNREVINCRHKAYTSVLTCTNLQKIMIKWKFIKKILLMS